MENRGKKHSDDTPILNYEDKEYFYLVDKNNDNLINSEIDIYKDKGLYSVDYHGIKRPI